MTQTNKGAVLLEALLALLLAGIIGWGVASLIRSTTTIARAIGAGYDDTVAAARIQALLLRMTASAHPLPGTSFISVSVDKTALPFLATTSQLANVGSCGITFIEFDNSSPLTRGARSGLEEGAGSYVFCPVLANDRSDYSGEPAHFLGGTLSGWLLVRSARASTRDHAADCAGSAGELLDLNPVGPECESARGDPSQCVHLASSARILGLLPVRDITTVYLDAKGTLRSHSHLHNQSQPVARHVAEWHCKLGTDSAGDLLRVRWRSEGNPEVERYADLPLGQENYGLAIDFIL